MGLLKKCLSDYWLTLTMPLPCKMYILNNRQCMTHPTLINLNPNEYSQGLRYCPFAVNLNRCTEIIL